MFNEDTELGKRYVFDIKRTCREVYDNSRRVLYQHGMTSSMEVKEAFSNYEGQETDKLKSEKTIQEILSCKICMDNEIDTLFLPCGHLVSCRSCAEK